jgi:flagellin
MALRINTNIESLVAQHRLDTTTRALHHSQEKLATGSRIVQAKDDAAGLAISENLRATLKATGQNIRNLLNGEYLLQTADSALYEVNNIVVRMKELAVASSSDTNGDYERGLLNEEYQSLKEELDRIANTTLFNGRPLLNGQGGMIEIQVGPNNVDAQDRIQVGLDYEVTTETMGLSELDISDRDGARGALDPIGDALKQIASTRGKIGAGESRLSTTLRSLTQYEENTAGAFSQIRDADIAFETAEYAKLNVLNQAGIAVLSQANSSPNVALKLLGS